MLYRRSHSHQTSTRNVRSRVVSYQNANFSRWDQRHSHDRSKLGHDRLPRSERAQLDRRRNRAIIHQFAIVAFWPQSHSGRNPDLLALLRTTAEECEVREARAARIREDVEMEFGRKLLWGRRRWARSEDCVPYVIF